MKRVRDVWRWREAEGNRRGVILGNRWGNGGEGRVSLEEGSRVKRRGLGRSGVE